MWVIIYTLFMIFVSIAVLVLKFEIKVDYPFKHKTLKIMNVLYIPCTFSNVTTAFPEPLIYWISTTSVPPDLFIFSK